MNMYKAMVIRNYTHNKYCVVYSDASVTFTLTYNNLRRSSISVTCHTYQHMFGWENWMFFL